MKNLFWLMFLPLTAIASNGPLQVQTVAEIEQVVLDESGEQKTILVPVTTVVPGDEVIYTITFTNSGSAAADAVTITDPVPEQMQYVAGSAFSAGADIQFSVDGGQSWGAVDELKVTDQNGEPKAAQASDYTHIRWVMRHPIDPGKRGYARFKASLR